jgi:N-acetylglutamate synthase/N-acetylornithine aminotransferase
MPRSYEEIVNQAEELSRVFEVDFKPAVSKEEAALRAAALRRALAESELGEAVAVARNAGIPWDRIGEAVGTSGEAARQKYRALAAKEKPVTTGH